MTYTQKLNKLLNAARLALQEACLEAYGMPIESLIANADAQTCGDSVGAALKAYREHGADDVAEEAECAPAPLKTAPEGNGDLTPEQIALWQLLAAAPVGHG